MMTTFTEVGMRTCDFDDSGKVVEMLIMTIAVTITMILIMGMVAINVVMVSVIL